MRDRSLSPIHQQLMTEAPSRLHVEIMHLLSPRWPGGRTWLTEGAGFVQQGVCRESPVKGDKMP